jgi:hypothetical protein
MNQPRRYDSFRFPQYQFREFPKYVTPRGLDGKKLEPVLVEDRDEERLVMRKPQPVVEMITEEAEVDLEQEKAYAEELPEVPPEPLTAEELVAGDQVVALRKRAKELNVEFSDRWGVTKLRRAIQAAQDDGQA